MPYGRWTSATGSVFGEFGELTQTQTTSAGVKYSNITLKRGYISSNPIWTWRSESATLEITGRCISGPRCRLIAHDAVVASVRGERSDGRAEVTLRSPRVEGRC